MLHMFHVAHVAHVTIWAPSNGKTIMHQDGHHAIHNIFSFIFSVSLQATSPRSSHDFRSIWSEKFTINRVVTNFKRIQALFSLSLFKISIFLQVFQGLIFCCIFHLNCCYASQIKASILGKTYFNLLHFQVLFYYYYYKVIKCM